MKLTRTCVLHCLQYTPTQPLPPIGSTSGRQHIGQNASPSTILLRGNAPSCLRSIRFIKSPIPPTGSVLLCPAFQTLWQTRQELNLYTLGQSQLPYHWVTRPHPAEPARCFSLSVCDIANMLIANAEGLARCGCRIEHGNHFSEFV